MLILQNEYQPLQLSDTVIKAQDLHNKELFSHFPVLNQTEFVGNLALEDVLFLDKDLPIADLYYQLDSFFIRDTDFWLESLDGFSKNQTNILPVLSNANAYLGYYELTDSIEAWFSTTFAKEAGTFIVIEKDMQQFSMSEIAQIVESNQTKILGMFISNTQLPMIEITLKVTPGNSNAVLQGLRRYGYEVTNTHEDDLLLTDLKERSEYLEKYLNI